jgi:hypothetical protein
MTQSVLVVTDVAPSLDLTGGIALTDVLDTLHLDTDIYVACFSNPNLSYRLSQGYGAHNTFAIPKSRELWRRGKRPVHRKLNGFLDQRVQALDTASRVRALKALTERLRPSALIVVAEGQSILSMAGHFRSLNLPIVTIHWDLFEWWGASHGLGSSRISALGEYEKQLAEISTVNLVPTPNFGSALGGTVNFTVVYPRAPRLMSEARVHQRTDDVIRLVAIGQGYSRSALEALRRLLSESLQRIAGYKVELHYIGGHGHQWTFAHEKEPWRSRGELVNSLGGMDIAFLPYSNPPESSMVTGTSYPSKLSIYSAAGLPVFAMSEGSPQFVNHLNLYRAGRSVSTHDDVEVQTEALEVLVRNRAQYSRGSREMFEALYSPEAHLSVLGGVWRRVGLPMADEPRFSTEGPTDVWATAGNLGRWVTPPSLVLERAARRGTSRLGRFLKKRI